MSDDPFAEPSDVERTIIRPRPSGVAAGRSAGTPTPLPARDNRPLPKTGSNPLVAAASPILAAAVRISSDRGQAPDIDRLRRAMVEAMRRFETEALATGMDTRSLRAARYALCATVDDLVLSTPWGSSSSWPQQSMTSIFHNEVTGGERFYDILDQMQKDLGNQEPVVELMYLCMSLGFIGRYRVRPYTMASWAELREGVYRTIRMRRGDFERELAPQWRGIAAGARSLAQRVPVWALGLGTVVCAALLYIGFIFLLAGTSEVSFAELYALPPRGQIVVPRRVAPPPVPPPPPVVVASNNTLAPKLRQFLAAEIKAGLVEVFEDAQTVTVRLTNRNMFASGEATIASAYGPILNRISSALNDETGSVTVYGYTDDQPIHTARFPSNFELSQARAGAVAAVLRTQLKDPARLHAQGKGQVDPIASNATEDGRRQNRRTEIVLVRASDAT
jgi:type VI secretion system protein ImpK